MNGLQPTSIDPWQLVGLLATCEQTENRTERCRCLGHQHSNCSRKVKDVNGTTASYIHPSIISVSCMCWNFYSSVTFVVQFQRLRSWLATATSAQLAEWTSRRVVDAAGAGTLGPSAGRCRSCRRSATVLSPQRPSARSSRQGSGARRGRQHGPRGPSEPGLQQGSWDRARSRQWPGAWWRSGRTRRRAAWTSSLTNEISKQLAAT